MSASGWGSVYDPRCNPSTEELSMAAEKKTADQLQIDWTTVALPGIDSNTVVLITGGTGALGVRFAEAFLTLGASVAVLSRSQARVGEVVEALGNRERVLGIAADITNEEQTQSAVQQVLDRFGRLYVLVQSAAQGGGGRLETITAEEIDAMFGANVKGMTLWQSPPPIRKRLISLSSPKFLDLKAEGI